jgi:hypothetical protein
MFEYLISQGALGIGVLLLWRSLKDVKRAAMQREMTHEAHIAALTEEVRLLSARLAGGGSSGGRYEKVGIPL